MAECLPYSRSEMRRLCRRISSLHLRLSLGDSRYAVHRVTIDELPPMQEVSRHSHSHFEAMIIFDGQLDHQTEGMVETYPAGSVILHAPALPHATHKSPKRCLTFVLDFTIYPAPPFGAAFRQAYWPDMQEDIHGLLREADQCFTGWQDRIYFRLQTLISRLMVLLDSALLHADEAEAVPDLAGRVDQYLRDHLIKRVSLPIVADAMGISERSLIRHFRRITGTTVHKYLEQLRMDLAGKLLIDQPDTPLHDICLQVGIADASYFARCFRRHHQHTPHQHRELEMVRKERKR